MTTTDVSRMQTQSRGTRRSDGNYRLGSAVLFLIALCGLAVCACGGGAKSFRTLEQGAMVSEPVVRTSAARGPSPFESPRVRRLSKRGWVEVETGVIASDDESPAAARRRALERARRAAVEFVSGVSIRSSVITLDHVSDDGTAELIQALTASQSDALIVDEKLLESRVLLSNQGGYRLRVKLAARVLEHKDGAATDFETEVRLNRSSFRAGDRVELRVRVSEAARVYVLSVSESGAVVLLPNRHLPDTRVPADTWLEFPGDELAGRGVAMMAQLPEGEERSQEALLVVALRGRRRLEHLFPASASQASSFRSASRTQAMSLASELLSPLMLIPASEWTFDQVVYTVSEN